MRKFSEIEAERDTDPHMVEWLALSGDEWQAGAWKVPSMHRNKKLTVIATTFAGWDHVSVSLKDRTPIWAEMETVKRLFFHPHETAMQLHVPVTDHISIHPHTLHLWRPQNATIPRPPNELVA